jgi:hypothetical protein
MRLSIDKKREHAVELLKKLESKLGGELTAALMGSVQADEADMVDVYEHTAVAIPENWRPVAFIPTVFARKTDAAVSSQISLFVDDGAGVTIDGAVQDLGVGYQIKWARFETGPAAAPWTQLLINQCQIGVKSEGTFI